MNPYVRAAKKHPQLSQQAREQLSRRPEHTPKPDKPSGTEKVIRRARDPQTGQFLPDNPETPNVDEAWVVAKK